MSGVQRWLAGALLAVALVGVALAQIVYESERPARDRDSAGAKTTTAPGLYRTGLAGADSDTATAPISPQRVWDGDTAILVSPRFTSAGATATVSVWRYHYTSATYTLLDVAAVQTATASSLLRAGAAGDYLTLDPLVFVAGGADFYDVRVHDVSAGTVSLMARTLGGGAGVAE